MKRYNNIWKIIFNRIVINMSCSTIFFAFLIGSGVLQAQLNKSVNEFVSILENNDYWFLAPIQNNSITDVNGDNYDKLLKSTYSHLSSFQRIELDYKYRADFQDPYHDLSIIELSFKDENDIHNFNSSDIIQIFPDCAGTKNITVFDVPNIFPLWDYKELVAGDIKWEYREYIEWYAIRYNKKVFIIYGMRLGNMNGIKDYVVMLYSYLIAESENEMDGLIRELHANKIKAPVAYDSVKYLQSTLLKCGFDPGDIDGKYGEDTENALIKLLIYIGYIDSSIIHSNISISHMIRMATRKFQKDNGLLITGRCSVDTVKAMNNTFIKKG